MNEQNDVNKIVLLIEDKLAPLEDILLNIQSILFGASKKRQIGAPENGDTKICLLHLLGKGIEADKAHFQRFKQILEMRQNALEDVPMLRYEYESMELPDTESYPGNANECADAVADKILAICGGKKYSIILDVILVESENKDRDALWESEAHPQILSQILYERFHDNCIPYTNYGAGEIKYRQSWEHGVTHHRPPLERNLMDGNSIYKPFRNELLHQLGIGEEAL